MEKEIIKMLKEKTDTRDIIFTLMRMYTVEELRKFSKEFSLEEYKDDKISIIIKCAYDQSCMKIIMKDSYRFYGRSFN